MHSKDVVATTRARPDERVQRLRTVPSVGLVTAARTVLGHFGGGGGFSSEFSRRAGLEP
jgi:hypothetical protein